MSHHRLGSLSSLSDFPLSSTVIRPSDEADDDGSLLVLHAPSKPASSPDDDPDHIQHSLRGLPMFPDPPKAVNRVPEAGFLLTGGPNTLIREVLLAPNFHSSAPSVLNRLLDHAIQLSSHNEFGPAMDRVADMKLIWQRRDLWREFHRVAFDSSIESFKAQEIVDRVEKRERIKQEQAEAAKAAAEMKKKAEEAERLRKLMEGDESKESESEERNQAETQDTNDTSDGNEDDSQVDSAFPLPSVSAESDLQFSLFVQNLLGSLALSAGKFADALIAFWQAKKAHERFVAVKDAQRVAETKEREAAERAERRKLSGQDHGEADDESSEEDEDYEDLAKKPLERRGSLSDPLFHMPIFPLNPFVLMSPAMATTWANLGAAVLHLGKPAIALNCFYAAHQIRLICIPPQEDEFVDVAVTLNNIGVCLSALNRFEESYLYYQSAEELMKHRLHPVHPRLNTVRANIEKIKTRRTAIKPPSLVVILDSLARARQAKLDELEAKRLAKEAKQKQKGGPGSASGARPTSSAGKNGEEEYKSLDQLPEYFATAASTEPRLPGHMPLRHWAVKPSNVKLWQLEFGKGKKAAKKK